MESVQRNARLQLPGAQDRHDETQDAGVHQPAGNWRDHVPAGHMQGDECLKRYFNDPRHQTLLLRDGTYNAAAMTMGGLTPVIRQAIHVQAAHMEGRKLLRETLADAQAELTQAENELSTAQRALTAARNMAGSPPEMELARVEHAVEQVRRKVEELGDIEREVESKQEVIDQGHAHLETRLNERDAARDQSQRNRVNRLALYALFMVVTVTFAATVGLGEEAINRGFNERQAQVPADDYLAQLQAAVVAMAQAHGAGGEVREVPGDAGDVHAAVLEAANRWRADAQQYDQWAPVLLTAGMLVVVFVVEALCVAVDARRFGQR